jgi:hypothetical protein
MTSSAAVTPSVEDLRDLDASVVLVAVVSARRSADREEARLLALAVHWVDLHPVTEDTPAATWCTEAPLLVHDGSGQAQPPAVTGAGAPQVAEYAVEELAAALNIGYSSGLRLVVEALELCYRLPRLWGLVQAGRLQAWKARQVTAHTTGLSRSAVAFVDGQLAIAAARNQVPTEGRIRALVHEARLRHDPDQAAAVEQVALEARGVWFDHRASTATTDVTARLDTLDAIDLENTVADLATTIGRLGDTRPLDIRRATALGMLANPQRTLDLVTGAAGDAGSVGSGDGWDTTGVAPEGAVVGTSNRWPNRSTGTLYLHVSAADLSAGQTTGSSRCAGGSVEKLGPATLDLLRDWLQRLDAVTVRPVLDMQRTEAVDAHDPPGWMRELVILRDGHCVFPGCSVDARSCDLDHIEAYVSPDDGGPPGQTHPGNLAALCRRHHRVKTHAGWTYRRDVDGAYLWASRRQRHYRTFPG